MMATAVEEQVGVSFEETENQKMIAQMIRDFGLVEIRPKMIQWDESQEFPIGLFKKMGALGLMGVLVPEEYGGAGFGLGFCRFAQTTALRNHLLLFIRRFQSH